jgi:hypothetical protein
MARAASVWRRGRRQLARSAASPLASIATANSAALAAPAGADGEGGHRDALGHLHDAVQRIDALQVAAGHRHAQHRHRGLGRQHARQVRRAAGPGDDGPQAARRRRLRRRRTCRRACGAPRPRGFRAARPAAGADVRGAVLHHDPPADEEAEGAQGHDRRRWPRATRWSSPAAVLGRVAKLGESFCTWKWPTAWNCRCSAPSWCRCCPRAPSSKPSRAAARPAPQPGRLQCPTGPEGPVQAAGHKEPTMNRYPWWKYAILGIALLVGLLYTAAQLLRRGAGRAGVQRQGHAQGRCRPGRRGSSRCSAGRLKPDFVQFEGNSVKARFGRHRHADQGQGRDHQGAEPRRGRPVATSSR